MVADYELDKALIKEGHSVTVLTCKGHKSDKGEEFLSSNHRIIRFSSLSKVQYGLSIGPIFGIIKAYLNNKGSIDIVWFGGVWNLLTIIGPLFCRVLSQRYIITPHGMLIPALIDMKSAAIKRMVIKLFLKSHLSNAHKVHFTVNPEFEETLAATKAKMQPLIFPLCFDLTRFNRADEDKKPVGSSKVTLSFIGRITPKKRIDLLIAALKVLPQDIKSQIRFNVVGVDENIWNQDGFTEIAVGVEINYNGPLYGADLIDAYHEADVFILCSESENFAISVVEAAYCYCVPLISKNVGVGQYFSDKSAVFSGLDEHEISERIEFLVRNPLKRRDIAAAARVVSEQFESASLGPGYFTRLLG